MREVTSDCGQTVRTPTISGLATVIDLRGLAAGIATLQLKTSGHYVAKRLVAE